MPLIDLTNRAFGMLMVLEKIAVKRGKTFDWRCKCACGNECIVNGKYLRNGDTKSCGCFSSRSLAKTHGASRTPTYKSWTSMKDRCYNAKARNYSLYGGRGIRVCERWLHSFENFLVDMGERPSLGHSLDRFPNNDGDYEPGNCRWATRKEQLWSRPVCTHCPKGHPYSGYNLVIYQNKKQCRACSLESGKRSLARRRALLAHTG